jgi:hypothetical protein
MLHQMDLVVGSVCLVAGLGGGLGHAVCRACQEQSKLFLNNERIFQIIVLK